jgi:AICAR transformylase/IMP cyclohydrolase PurH
MAKKKAKKKVAKKKATKKAKEVLVVASKVKAYVKSQGMMSSSDEMRLPL